MAVNRVHISLQMLQHTLHVTRISQECSVPYALDGGMSGCCYTFCTFKYMCMLSSLPMTSIASLPYFNIYIIYNYVCFH